MNTLYYGDNLPVMRQYIAAESVDLVYLDPPFNSNASYNVLFEEHGERSAAQIKAFEDTWEWSTESRAAYEEVVEAGGLVSDAMRAFHTMLGTSDLMAYLAMMAPRLIELSRVMKPTASIYLHCDPTASHYLKILMDAVFGARNFRNEVIWKRTTAHSDTKQGMARYGKIHDVLLFYVKGSDATFNAQFTPYDEEYIESHYRFIEPETGRRYRKGDLTGSKPGGDTEYEWKGVRPYKGRYWAYSKEKMERFEAEGRLVYTKSGMPEYKRYLDEMPGTSAQDIWDDIAPINSQAAERLGYPTQKPIALLERIIASSSDPGDTVLDPFCGCGTAIDAAQALNRQWIGIDITHLAIGLMRHRLASRYGPEVTRTYRVIGEPATEQDAAVLAREDPFQFQAWALGLVGARMATSAKKGGDKGADGRLYFHDSPGGPTRQIILSVKAGDHLVPAFVDQLRGVIEKEHADIGVLISFAKPTAGMRKVAAEAGFYQSAWGRHPRLQLLTVGELLHGKRIDYPPVTGANVTHKRAQPWRIEPERPELFAKVAEDPGIYGSAVPARPPSDAVRSRRVRVSRPQRAGPAADRP